MSWRAGRWLSFIVFLLSALSLNAGGSGLNVLVVVNQNSTNSIQLGNYFCERRQVPPQNLVRIYWSGGNIVWTRSEFENVLVTPVQNAIAARALTNQIDYIVLSMDIPYRVIKTNGANSTTSALFYGFKPDDPPPLPGFPESCSLPAASFNAYAGSEGIFRHTAPGTNANSWLVTMITASNLNLARDLVDHGAFSDGSFPTQAVVLAKTTDPARNIRYAAFDNAIFDTRIRGNSSMTRTNSDSPFGLTNVLGYQTGLWHFDTLADMFVPGAMADSLTSYGGTLFENSGQKSLLGFTHAGAAGGYGTVIEPCAYLEKFPDPLNYFYQARGFSIAESYYQSVLNPYQGLTVGEPLAAPFAVPASGAWNNLPSHAVLAGVTNLSLQFNAPDATRPVQQADLFINGLFRQTLTNIAPASGNVLYVTLSGKTNMSYTVPPGANLKSIAEGVAAGLNMFANSNVTKVVATPRGDRIELRLTALQFGSQIFVGVSNSAGSAPALTTFLQSNRSNLLDSVAHGIRDYSVSGTVNVGSTLQVLVTKTNGATLVVAVTNNTPGATLTDLALQFLSSVNSTPALQGSDGLTAEDLVGGNGTVFFNLRARSPGLAAAQIRGLVSSSLVVGPQANSKLNVNLPDLQGRHHLYVTAGAANLPITFPLDTTTLPDGFHELTAVAYEGSHVRTQKRITQTVRIQNSSLSAVFTQLAGGAQTVRDAVLQFAVAANTNNISSIELFSTGGLLAMAVNQPSAIFAIAGTNLDTGLHPFHAVVTRVDGRQYRTETKWVRLVGPEPPFSVTLMSPPPALSWFGTVGRQYDVLSTTNLLQPFQLRASVSPTNSDAQWVETDVSSPQRFYRVRASP